MNELLNKELETKNYDELVADAVALLKNDDETFVECVNELDAWDGYADGFRAYPMEELDDLWGGVKLSDFLSKLGRNFSYTDDYFVETIYGIESTDHIVDLYRSNVDENDLVFELVDKYSHLDIKWIDADLDELIRAIDEYSDED